MDQADEDAAKQRTAEKLAKLAKLARVALCEPLCGALESTASPSPAEDDFGGIGTVSDEERRTKEKAG